MSEENAGKRVFEGLMSRDRSIFLSALESLPKGKHHLEFRIFDEVKRVAISLETSVLHIVAENDWKDGIDLAVASGAPINAIIYGSVTPLSHAISFSSANAALALLKHGAEVSEKDLSSCTSKNFRKMRRVASAILGKMRKCHTENRLPFLESVENCSMEWLSWCLDKNSGVFPESVLSSGISKIFSKTLLLGLSRQKSRVRIFDELVRCRAAFNEKEFLHMLLCSKDRIPVWAKCLAQHFPVPEDMPSSSDGAEDFALRRYELLSLWQKERLLMKSLPSNFNKAASMTV